MGERTRRISCVLDPEDEIALIDAIRSSRPAIHLEDQQRFVLKLPVVIPTVAAALGSVVYVVDSAAWRSRPTPGPGMHLIQLIRTHESPTKVTAGGLGVTFQPDDPESVAVTKAALDAVRFITTPHLIRPYGLTGMPARIGRYAERRLRGVDKRIVGTFGGPDYLIK